jgi:flagellar hook-length control protein FliK
MSPVAATAFPAAPPALSAPMPEGEALAAFSALVSPLATDDHVAPLVHTADLAPESAPGDPAATMLLGSGMPAPGVKIAPLSPARTAGGMQAEAVPSVPAAPTPAPSTAPSGRLDCAHSHASPHPENTPKVADEVVPREDDTTGQIQTITQPPSPIALPEPEPAPALRPHPQAAQNQAQAQMSPQMDIEIATRSHATAATESIGSEAASSRPAPQGLIDTAAPHEKPQARSGSVFAELIAPPASSLQQAVPTQTNHTPPPDHPAIPAQAGRIGQELGIAIAHHTSQGGDELTVRLDPAHFGQIEVKMHFDAEGQLRASVTTSQNATLDLLRRDSAELTRAMNDAGISTDAQSFSFSSRQDTPQGDDRTPARFTRSAAPAGESIAPPLPIPAERPRPFAGGGGRINMVA